MNEIKELFGEGAITIVEALHKTIHFLINEYDEENVSPEMIESNLRFVLGL